MLFMDPAQELFAIFFAIYFSLVIDRANHDYRPFDTYNAWRGSYRAIRRLVTGWIILTFMPLTQFAVVLVVLGSANVTLAPTISDIFAIVAIGFLSFFCWGYYRIYAAILFYSPSAFYPEEELKELLEERQEFLAHFFPGLLYVVSSIPLLLLTFLLQGH